MKKFSVLLMSLVLAVLPAGTAFCETADGAAAEPVVEAEAPAAEEILTAEPAPADEVTADAAPAVEEVTEGYEDIFADWNQDAASLNTLIEYVEAVTDEESQDYIPVEDRIAVFDMDGTVYGELFPTYLEYYMLAWTILKNPDIQPDEEMLAVGRALRDGALDKSFPEEMPMQHAIQAARAYSGMTLNEFADYVTQFLIREADGFQGMTYGEAVYAPIVEVIDYLNENGFKVYICSGSDRFICRTLLEGVVDVPAENIIGMDVAVEATNQNGEDGRSFRRSVISRYFPLETAAAT